MDVEAVATVAVEPALHQVDFAAFARFTARETVPGDRAVLHVRPALLHDEHARFAAVADGAASQRELALPADQRSGLLAALDLRTEHLAAPSARHQHPTLRGADDAA